MQSKNRFLGWHRWNQYEVFGLFQKIADDTWWFSGPGEGMSFRADLLVAKKATMKEIKELIDLED